MDKEPQTKEEWLVTAKEIQRNKERRENIMIKSDQSYIYWYNLDSSATLLFSVLND